MHLSHVWLGWYCKIKKVVKSRGIWKNDIKKEGPYRGWLIINGVFKLAVYYAQFWFLIIDSWAFLKNISRIMIRKRRKTWKANKNLTFNLPKHFSVSSVIICLILSLLRDAINISAKDSLQIMLIVLSLILSVEAVIMSTISL